MAFLIGASVLLFCAVVALFLALSQSADTLRDRVDSVESDRNLLTDSPAGPLVRVLAALNTTPLLDGYNAHLEKQLVEAGHPGGIRKGPEFLAAMELTAIGAFLAFAVLMAVLGTLDLTMGLFALLLGVGSGWLVEQWLDGVVKDRRRSISRQLPFFLDLAVMAMESGASLQESMEIYERDNPEDDFAGELRVALGEMKMGKTMHDALVGISERVDVDMVNTLVMALVQAQKLGTPLGRVLREQAELMRFRRTQDAERLGEELKVRIQGPVMIMMIAVFLLILGPAIVETANSGLF